MQLAWTVAWISWTDILDRHATVSVARFRGKQPLVKSFVTGLYLMKILTDATTPFGRKAVVCALERGIAFDEVFVAIDASLDVSNPLRQIPAMQTDDGRLLFDSDTIVLYLHELSADRPLIPADDKFAALTRMALANGLMEAVLLRTMEGRRTDGERSQAFIDKLGERAVRAIQALNAQVSNLNHDELNAADIGTACALEYADFRFTKSWRDSAPPLARWLASVASRPSFAATRPTRSTPVRSNGQ